MPFFVLRWRPLESAFAILGSQAESILDISNDEHDAGPPRPIDIEYLLTHVIPSLLTLSGSWHQSQDDDGTLIAIT